MTLILKLDLDMVKMYHHTKHEGSMPRHSKVLARTDRNTHRQTDIMIMKGSTLFWKYTGLVCTLAINTRSLGETFFFYLWITLPGKKKKDFA